MNYQTIPSKLWEIFPAHGQYLVNLLKFCGYQSRETIIKLKDEKEIVKMFQFAGKHHDLLDQEEKNATFGIFSRKPTAVMILPGLTPVFRRFVKEVDDLIPKTKQTTSCIFQKPAQKPTPKPVSSSVTTSPSSSIKEVTIESITMRMENWLEKEKQKHPQINISIEEGMKKFSITLTEMEGSNSNANIKVVVKFLC